MNNSTPRDLIVYRLELADGTTLERGYNPIEPRYGGRGDTLPAGYHSPPQWLENTGRDWPRAGGPMFFTGTVSAGAENEARAWLGIT